MGKIVNELKRRIDMLSRRSFLKIAGISLAAIGLPVKVKANDIVREPYVKKGEVVSWIGMCPGGFTGGQIVEEVRPWDGTGYPVITRNNSYGPRAATEPYYDQDLCNFNRETPMRFWANPKNKKYPNLHTYVRCKRFGETIEQAKQHLNFYSLQ